MKPPYPWTPLYTHDCEMCLFLGIYEGMDLYFCPQLGNPTLVARRSSDGADYTSGVEFVESVPALAIARLRAQTLGFLP